MTVEKTQRLAQLGTQLAQTLMTAAFRVQVIRALTDMELDHQSRLAFRSAAAPCPHQGRRTYTAAA